MKTTAIHMAGALILTACLGISCRKEQPSRIGDNAPVTVTATISDAADTKVTYSEDGNKLKSAWAVGDRIVGWTEAGAALELEIAGDDRIVSGTAVFTTVSGSAALPASGKIYMIYAPGKHRGDIVNKSLSVDLSMQESGVIPALMMATGSVTDRQIKLDFLNQMSIVAVKNPKFPEARNSMFGGFVLSGTNVNTSVKFDLNGVNLRMTASAPGAITKIGSFITNAQGGSDITFYFAVPPASTTAEVSFGSFLPDKYAFYVTGRKFERNKCYNVNQPQAQRLLYGITAKQYDGGTFTTSPAGRSPWGREVTVSPAPTDQHWEFDSGTLKVTIDGSSTGVALLNGKFTMPQADVTVDGSFKKKKYTLTATATTNGSFTLKNGSTVITSGSSVEWDTVITVVPVPAAGYVVDKVTYTCGGVTTDATPGSSNYSFKMPKGTTSVKVTFKIQVQGTTPEYPIVPW